MIHQPTQIRELATAARAMIDLLSMDRARQMLVQCRQIVEATLAQVAAIPISVPGRAGGYGGRGGGIVLVPANLLVCKDVVGVDLAAVGVDFGAVDAGGAGAAFEVVTYAGEVGEHIWAPRALDILAFVDGGIEMLLR